MWTTKWAMALPSFLSVHVCWLFLYKFVSWIIACPCMRSVMLVDCLCRVDSLWAICLADLGRWPSMSMQVQWFVIDRTLNHEKTLKYVSYIYLQVSFSETENKSWCLNFSDAETWEATTENLFCLQIFDQVGCTETGTHRSGAFLCMVSLVQKARENKLTLFGMCKCGCTPKQLGPYSRCLAWNSAMMPVICAFYTRPWLLQRPLMCRWESNTHTYELLVTTNFSCLSSLYPTGLSVGRETLWFWRTLWVKLVWVWLLTNSLWCKLFDKWEEVIQCNDNACMSWGIAHT